MKSSEKRKTNENKINAILSKEWMEPMLDLKNVTKLNKRLEFLSQEKEDPPLLKVRRKRSQLKQTSKL